MTHHPAATSANQPPLDGIADTQAVAVPLEVAVIGVLAADAVVRTVADNTVLLEVLVAQELPHHPQAHPVSAAMVIPNLGSFATTHERATKHAALLRNGTAVVVRGRGLEMGTRHGLQVLRLITPLGIYPASQMASRALNGDTNVH